MCVGFFSLECALGVYLRYRKHLAIVRYICVRAMLPIRKAYTHSILSEIHCILIYVYIIDKAPKRARTIYAPGSRASSLARSIQVKIIHFNVISLEILVLFIIEFFFHSRSFTRRLCMWLWPSQLPLPPYAVDFFALHYVPEPLCERFILILRNSGRTRMLNRLNQQGSRVEMCICCCFV